MKPNNTVINAKRIIAYILGVMLCWGAILPEIWAAVDVYVIYGGKSKKEKRTFLNHLPKEVSVKTYNVDLLAVADYSGRQKAQAKFQQASVIVVLLDKPMNILKGAMLKSDLIIVQSVLTGVTSATWMLYVLSKGTDYSKLGKNFKTFEATAPETLERMKNLKAVDAILVNTQDLDIFRAASLVTETILGQ